MSDNKKAKLDVQEQLAALQAKLDKAERDNARLRQNNESMAGMQPIQDRLMSEMDKLNKASRDTSGKITMKHIHDHTNVYLYWTNGYHIGKRVGGLHPANAKVEMQRFARRGIQLSITPPTAEEISAYKATDEWQRLSKEFEASRANKVKTRGKGEIDKLARAIEQLSGTRIKESLISSQPV